MEKITSRIGPVSLSFLLLFTYLVKGDIFELRDIKFDSNYNKYELPPSHDGKPLLVSNFQGLSHYWLIHDSGLNVYGE